LASDIVKTQIPVTVEQMRLGEKGVIKQCIIHSSSLKHLAKHAVDWSLGRNKMSYSMVNVANCEKFTDARLSDILQFLKTLQ